MVHFNIEKLLKQKNKSKYWLCQNMNITSRNLNRVIKVETSSISFKYIEDLCKYLDCSIDELIDIEKDAWEKRGRGKKFSLFHLFPEWEFFAPSPFFSFY